MGCKPWRQSYVGASSRTHPSLSLIDFPFCTGQWVPAYKPLCKCFRISKPHTSLISTSSATYCPNDLSTLLFTRIPRMGSLYLPSALASFFFFFFGCSHSLSLPDGAACWAPLQGCLWSCCHLFLRLRLAAESISLEPVPPRPLFLENPSATAKTQRKTQAAFP